MSDKSVEERVIRVFAEFKKVPAEEITMETTFEELRFDSLDGLNLVFELEEEFDLTIPDDRVGDMKGVRQAVEGIEALLRAKDQGSNLNTASVDEFRRRQEEVKTPTTTESDDPGANAGSLADERSAT